MEKLSVNESQSLRKLRNKSGMRSMVELRPDGAVAAQRGSHDSDLTSATTDFIRIGQKLGQSLGLEQMLEMHVIQPHEAVTFAECNDRKAGVIHQDVAERLLDTNHGT
ncbi:hypothetical protein [Cerasicoccus maritimus]|uniref:hypothetical protein n=1 Tax=Cerasicoccus maritimus TaxID=490089 RepID=UPI00285264B6|nr:hypothetical protein [Cerasicoccus maritimus]